MDIVEFLTARLNENQATAEGAQGSGSGKWRTVSHFGEEARRVEGETPDEFSIYDEGGHDEHQAAHIARHDPAHVLAEVAAQRRILVRHWDGNGCPVCLIEMDVEEGPDGNGHGYPVMHWTEPCETLRDLAAPYADHPDYDPAWAVA